MQNANQKKILYLQKFWQNPSNGNFVYSCDKKPANLNSDWDWSLPAETTNIGTDLFPLAFGCEQIETSISSQWIKPLIHCPSDAEKIEIPPVNSSKCGAILDLTANLKLRSGCFIRQTDIQSPLSVAELMWDDSFYIALKESPGSVHCLLDKITTFIISFIDAQKTIAKDQYIAAGFPLIWSPPFGTMIGDDMLSLISPEMHLEFSIPYLNRISRACGGLYYHTCSLFPKYFDNIHQIENILSLNWNPGNSAPAHKIIQEFSGKCIIAPHIYPEIHKTNNVLDWPGKKFADEIEFMDYCINSKFKSTSMSCWIRGDIAEDPVLTERFYKLFDFYGFTPAKQLNGADYVL